MSYPLTMPSEIDPNLFLSQQKADSGMLNVALHPLVLLTISDLITRHALRNMQTPLIGGLLGQNKGEEITVEHAFECLPVKHEDGQWWQSHIVQMLKVHTSPHETPDLCLIGWFTLVPSSGPHPDHTQSHLELTKAFGFPMILLGFHPSSSLGVGGSLRGKFPLTIYEATYSNEMAVDVPTPIDSAIRFVEVPYSVETGEAEMIGLSYVSKGGGNASATDWQKQQMVPEKAAVGKGKKRAVKDEAQEIDAGRTEEQNILSREEEELVASLTTKANAIKMLQSRIDLITMYLENLPPSFVIGDTSTVESEMDGNHTTVNHSILRSIQAMLHRLSLLIPSDNVAFSRELLSERNDVNLINLLSTLTQSIEESREVGRKFAIVDQGRQNRRSIKKMGGNGPSDFDTDRWPRDFGSSVGVSGVGDLMSG